MPHENPSVRDLRRQWKPHKERLNSLDGGHPTNVRFHRACSWIQHAEQVSVDGDLDLKLLSQWIAFNALYGQWNDDTQEVSVHTPEIGLSLIGGICDTSRYVAAHGRTADFR
jgi:hypothetical protein